MRFVSAILFLFLLVTFPAAADAAEEELWALLRNGGAIAMIRHAEAPGVGDPSHFELSDCATQRNLSKEGRAQARGLGEAFRRERIPIAQVLSSRWCRCLDTARLAFGELTPFAPLDSFFGQNESGNVQTQAVKDHIIAWNGEGTLVLVTHQVNITALTGVYPRSGEVIVLMRDGGDLKVAGRLNPSFDFAAE